MTLPARSSRHPRGARPCRLENSRTRGDRAAARILARRPVSPRSGQDRREAGEEKEEAKERKRHPQEVVATSRRRRRHGTVPTPHGRRCGISPRVHDAASSICGAVARTPISALTARTLKSLPKASRCTGCIKPCLRSTANRRDPRRRVMVRNPPSLETEAAVAPALP